MVPYGVVVSARPVATARIVLPAPRYTSSLPSSIELVLVAYGEGPDWRHAPDAATSGTTCSTRLSRLPSSGYGTGHEESRYVWLCHCFTVLQGDQAS